MFGHRRGSIWQKPLYSTFSDALRVVNKHEAETPGQSTAEMLFQARSVGQAVPLLFVGLEASFCPIPNIVLGDWLWFGFA